MDRKVVGEVVDLSTTPTIPPKEDEISIDYLAPGFTLWAIVAVVFGLVGGIAGYLAFVAKNKNNAYLMLKIGAIVSFIWALIFFVIFLRILSFT